MGKRAATVLRKVYFACSISGGGDTSNYRGLVDCIKNAGGTILSEVFVNDVLELGGSPLPKPDIYQRDIAMIQEADVVIAEVTNPSLGVGYELGYAESLGKPTLCLFDESSKRVLSAMVEGNPHNQVTHYSGDQLPAQAIAEFIAN